MPDALLLNYVNPLSIVTGGILAVSEIRTVGLCHSVQICVPRLLQYTGIDIDPGEMRWKNAGINHMAWLLEIHHKDRDLYPEIKRRAKGFREHKDRLRFEIKRRFGYYVTESSEHNTEYTPYWIKRPHPELIEEYHIPLDEYPCCCRKQIREWEQENEKDLDSRAGSRGLIPNLPAKALVELPCLVDRNGVQGVYAGEIPIQCAALNSAACRCSS